MQLTKQIKNRISVLVKREESRQNNFLVDNIVGEYRHPEMEHWAEEYECAMMHLDDLNIPKDDGCGNDYSLVGRIDIAIKKNR